MESSRDTLLIVVELLVDLTKRTPDTLSDRGICSYLRRGGVSLPISFVERYSKTWPKYSGNSFYPVPAPDGSDPRKFYYFNHKWLGKYGLLRLELVEYLIEKINQELANV